MAREFVTRSHDDADVDVARGIISREQELAAYDLNIASITAQLEIVGEPTNEVDARHRQQLLDRLQSEQYQCRICEVAYSSLLEMLPAGSRRDAAFAKVLAPQ